MDPYRIESVKEFNRKYPESCPHKFYVCMHLNVRKSLKKMALEKAFYFFLTLKPFLNMNFFILTLVILQYYFIYIICTQIFSSYPSGYSLLPITHSQLEPLSLKHSQQHEFSLDLHTYIH